MDTFRRAVRIPAWVVMVVVLALTTVQLHYQGRIWWCACGGFTPWSGDIWSAHTSQHVLDPYSFTHMLHGVVLCGIMAWLLPRWPLNWRLVLAIMAEGLWEIMENSSFVINRYREATSAVGYSGDSIVNSLADIACCTAGFLLARRLGFRRSAILFVLTELLLLAWVRDNLTLNMLMLTFPVDSIKAWQMIH
ncbi:MAG: DUF2585 family protein [bacterium]